MFLLTKPKGVKDLGLQKFFAEKTKVLTDNQGYTNDF